jgi:hypothetical protein
MRILEARGLLAARFSVARWARDIHSGARIVAK